MAAFSKKKKKKQFSSANSNNGEITIKCYIWSVALCGADTWTL
jgi:hypothetical protein